MPRFHFNVHDGHSGLDDEGHELVDLKIARREAVRLTGLILADRPEDVLSGGDWRLEVTDETGLILFRLDVGILESSAIAGRPDYVQQTAMGSVSVDASLRP